MAGDEEATTNPLVVTYEPSEASPNVELHPLVLLTISDHITRHTLRSQGGPIVGAIIGQQIGHKLTFEHAYHCTVVEQGGQVLVDEAWFIERLEQYKAVHKAPALDLLALFTLGPVGGPQPAHIPLLQQVQKLTSVDGLMLLLFHSDLVDKGQGGKLPVTVYEPVHEQVGDDAPLKFRELPYDVESGDAERISIDYVAQGAGNASAGNASAAPTGYAAASTSSDSTQENRKGKGKDKEKDSEDVDANGSINPLTPEDEEMLLSLNARANAIKSLNQRINLIKLYLQTLPPSYLSDTSSPVAPPETTNHALLRQIQAMLSRLPLLLSPTVAQPGPSSTEHHLEPNPQLMAGEKEKQDVHLMSLLAALTRSVYEAQGLSNKFHVMQRERERTFRSDFGSGKMDSRGDEGLTSEGGGPRS